MSLRLRLMGLTLGVVAVSLATVALLSRRAVRLEVARVEGEARDAVIAGASAVLAATPAGEIDVVLARQAASSGQEMLLMQDGRVRAASSDVLRRARVKTDGDRIEIEVHETTGRELRARRTVLVGAPHTAVVTADGQAGELWVLPALDGGAADARLDRTLLGAAALAGLVATLMTLAWTRRIVGPVEALTAAARRMGEGDLSARVGVIGGGEIGELARAFDAMAEAIARTEALRRTLVGDVAHELRTPITNLRCQLEAVQDGLQRADEATLRSLHEEVVLLTRLVDDLQELALAESGQLPLARGPVDAGEVVALALAGVGATAQARGVALDAAIEPDLVVDADRARLGQVLRNLLINAVAHTPAGGRVEVGATASGTSAVFEVADTGAGIAPEHLPHVFDRFWRADPSRTRATGGSGLGLAIVRQLVEAQGGKVRAEAREGGGARLVFTLPRAFTASSREARIT